MTGNTVYNFPNGLAPKSEKDTKAYGIKVAQAVMGATNIQRAAFRKKLFENRKYAEGNQELKQYLDELEIDGQKMYTNIAYRARPIAQKFKNVVVNGYLMKNEYPSVIATSKHIKDRKEKKKSDAEMRMEYGDVLNQISQEAGVPLVDGNEFTPKTKEESDIYFSLNDKEKEELMMQEMVSFTLRDNDIESIKNNVLDDQFVAQFHGYYNYIDDNGRLIIDYIQPEDIVCDNSRYEDFHDAGYKGRWFRTTVSEARARYRLTPDDEHKLFECAYGFAGKMGNSSVYLDWKTDYRNAEYRPYDNYTIELLHVWWKTSKVLTYTEGKDNYGREVFDINYSASGSPVKSDGKKTVGVKYPQTAYEGIFTAGGALCLEWGEQRNILRKGEDKIEVLSPFIFFMPYNKGRMLPNSLMSLMIDSIRNMDIAILKIKQIIAKSTPDDYMIDIDALTNLDLGTGDLMQPLDIVEIHQQTGRLYYKGKDEEGNTQAPPVRASLNPISDKLRTMVDWYNTELNNIRDYLGVNEFRDGSASNPRTGFRFMQAQSEASNTATWFVYRAYVKSTEELIKQIGIRIWDALNYGEVNKGYLKYLGKENIDFIQSRKDITASSYDMEFKLGIDESDKATLEKYVDTCLANGQLEMPDALMINRVQDPILAEKLLTYVYEKRRKQKMEEAQENQKSAADYSAQVGVKVEEAKQQTSTMLAQADMAKEKSRGENEQIGFMIKGAMAMIEESFKTGVPIPEVYMPFVNLALSNAAAKTEQTLTATQKEVQAEAVQEQQQELLQQLQQAVQSGDMTEQEAQAVAQQNGIQ